ncbi:hypothetical protein J1G35_10485 [Pseudomonas sp. SH10-3B]|uniref:hypothetical protein n=1 Tax=Pseudomonas sp. SH10-3B TaxID=2816049 RepID=UPI001CA78932|nr:hypothetical protein [Pseudomonas sp. SH10-3B]MBY8946292.1 hypothetical protein [Pseudomonas sp. SH10-3B]
MTTNQTIDGMPRKYVMHLTDEAHSVLLGMVEHCLKVRACMGMDEGYSDYENEMEEHDFVKELRALLGAKPDGTLTDEGTIPAAQPQGEPVYMKPQYLSVPGLWIVCKAGEIGAKPFYAEQPAPVAVVLPERLDIPHREEFESADQYCAAIGEAKKWNACLDELKRLNPSL